MRAKRAARALELPILLLSLACAAPGLAQQRTAAPTAERKAFNALPGPDAEYLLLSDRYTLKPDGSVVHERTSRLQVNSYFAINRKYGESKVDYDPVIETLEVLTNRTVLPSGQVVDAPANAVVDDQPPAAEGNPLWSGLRRKIIVHTALEPGAVIEEAWRVTDKPGTLPWVDFAETFYAEVPIRERTIVADLPAGTPFHWHVLAAGGGESHGRRVGGRELREETFHDLPAIPDEPGAPLRAETAMLVASSCPSFQALQQELNRRVGAAGEVPASLTELAQRAAEKELTDDGRVLAVMEAVAAAVRVTPIPPALQHFRPAPPAEVWRLGVATPLELAVLQSAALRAVGFFNVSPVLAAPEHLLLDQWPALSGLDRPLVAVGMGAAGIRLYDPAKPSAGGPLELSVSPRNIVAVFAMAADTTRSRLSVATGRSLTVVVDVGSDRKARGKMVFTASGAVTPHAALLRDPAKLAGEFAGLLPDGKASNVRVTALARDGATLEAELTATLPEPDAFGLLRLAFPGVPGGVNDELPPLPSLSRRAPLLMPFPQTEALQIELTLPAGWSLASAPMTFGGPERGPVRFSVGVEGARVRLSRSIEVGRRLVAPVPDQLAEARSTLVAWQSPDGRELLLRVPSGAAKK
jgi:hypothetical protein